MDFSARNITAATLAALLAAWACFEHALHDVSHASSPQNCCADGKLSACDARSPCSHDHGSDKAESTPDKPAPPEHNPDTCAVCRFLTLPQLFEPPQEFAFAVALVCEDIVESTLSFASRLVTLVPIRGPPASELQLPC